jgi:hypothetical protein
MEGQEGVGKTTNTETITLLVTEYKLFTNIVQFYHFVLPNLSSDPSDCALDRIRSSFSVSPPSTILSPRADPAEAFKTQGFHKGRMASSGEGAATVDL